MNGRPTNNLFIVSLFLILQGSVFCQITNYYFYQDQQITVTTDQQHFYIQVNSSFSKADVINLGFENFEMVTDENLRDTMSNSLKWAVIESSTLLNQVQYYQRLNSLKGIVGVEVVEPSIFFSEGGTFSTTNYLYVKLFDASDYSTLQAQANLFNLSIVRPLSYLSNWYMLTTTSSSPNDVIESCKILHETGLFDQVDPDIILDIRLSTCSNAPNDPLFNNQWYLYNSGGLDINICDAWGYATGNGVTIGVLDEGISPLQTETQTQLNSVHFNTEWSASPTGQVTTSDIVRYGTHGDHSAGIIGASRDNGQSISGIAPDCKLVSMSNDFVGFGQFPWQQDQQILTKMAEGIVWAATVGNVDIINCSWEGGNINGYPGFAVLDDAINDCFTIGRNGLGTLIVFAAGNNTPVQGQVTNPIHYPNNSHPDLMVVGSMDLNGELLGNSCYGDELDIIAPGVNIATHVGNFQHTSAAAPQVTAIAALILELNPCLTIPQVNAIIEASAVKTGDITQFETHPDRPHGKWYKRKGYGLVNAGKACELAIASQAATFDLFIKDRHDDLGYEESYPYTWPLDESSDIWVRNVTPDGIQNQDHQDPNYTNATWVYVRVWNNGCLASNGGETVDLYWSKAAGGSSWPSLWDGTDPSLGNQIGTQTLPSIQPGDFHILQFQWTVLNPVIFDNWSTCLLAKMNEPTDPDNPYANLGDFIYYNNNISLKNTVLTNVKSDPTPSVGGVVFPHGSYVYLGNGTNAVSSHDLVFTVPTDEFEGHIIESAEVTLTFDHVGWNIISPLLTDRTDVKVLSGNRIQLLEREVVFEDITFAANVRIPVYVGFNFLIGEVTSRNNYRYHVLQRNAVNDPDLGSIWNGGIHFSIEKEDRPPFEANAGMDQHINIGSTVDLVAEDIGEQADYIWTDEQRNIVGTGLSVSFQPQSSMTYTLEVRTGDDGFKDYDDVVVNVDPFFISSVSPNPSSGVTVVEYEASSALTAEIVILGSVQSGVYVSKTIQSIQNSTTIDVSNFPTGSFSVLLYCNGMLEDVKTLIVL